MPLRDARKEDGLIATLSDGTVHHRGGSVREAAREIAELCDRGGVVVACLSRPSTILGDLTGKRILGGVQDGVGAVTYPEAHFLGLIGRRDLLPEHMRGRRSDLYPRRSAD